MKLLIKLMREDDLMIDMKVFTLDKNEPVSETNANNLSGLFLLAIRWLSNLGPY